MKTDKHRVLFALCLLAITVVHAFASPGAWDQTFAPTVTGGSVYTMAMQTDGKLLIGGGFTAVNASGSRSHLARLYSDGSLDTTFFNTGSGVYSTIWSITVQSDGRIVIGGDFTSVNGIPRTRVARLNVNGTVDGSFISTNAINGSVLALAAQSDNKIVIGGSFTKLPFPSWNARLNADGTTDTTFSSYPNGQVNAIAIQTDGKIVIGGAFTVVNGAPRNRIARLNSDGSLDNTFQNGLTGASGIVRCLQIQADGKILIGGDFISVNGTPRGNIARLNSNGSLDAGFSAAAGAYNSVYALAVQTDGRVVIAGSFSGLPANKLSRVARLYADGTLDTSFSTFGINNQVHALAVQGDGALLIGGAFTTINNTNRPFLGRLYGNLYPPEFVAQPISQGANIGATVTFSANINNPPPSYFQWRKDGNNIAGATGTSYTLYNVQVADAGNYSVFASNAVGGTTSSNALLQVGNAPVIVQQPLSVTNSIVETADFRCTITGTSPISLQWTLSDSPLPGATNATLTITNLQPGSIGYYALTATNIFGGTVSSNAALSLTGFDFGLWNGLVAYYPFNGNANDASGNSNDGTVSGAILAMDRFLSTNSAYSFDGSTAFIDCGNKPAFNFGQSDFTICTWIRSAGSQANKYIIGKYSNTVPSSFGLGTGGNAAAYAFIWGTSSEAASGTTILADNNWHHLMAVYKRNSNLTIYRDGAMQAQKDITALQGAMITNAFPLLIGKISSGQNFGGLIDDVRIYNRALSSSEVTQLYSLEADVPVVTQQPQSQTVTLGSTVSFSVTATVDHSLTYQWFKDGFFLTGFTNNSLFITNVQPKHIGYYSVAVSNAFTGVISSNAALNMAGQDFGLWNGLAAYYPFSGNANDETGNGNNGEPNGVVLTTDRFGDADAAYNFNGNGYIQIPDNFGFKSPAFTISMWFDARFFPNDGGLREAEFLISKGTSNFELHLYTAHQN
jgi:uncharacterized delta-60 repeat protein